MYALSKLPDGVMASCCIIWSTTTLAFSSKLEDCNPEGQARSQQRQADQVFEGRQNDEGDCKHGGVHLWRSSRFLEP